MTQIKLPLSFVVWVLNLTNTTILSFVCLVHSRQNMLCCHDKDFLEYMIVCTEGPKVTFLVARSSRGRCAQHLHDVRGLHDTHRTQILRVIFAWHFYAPDSRRIRPPIRLNVARTCRARSEQQWMLRLDPSVYTFISSDTLRTQTKWRHKVRLGAAFHSPYKIDFEWGLYSGWWTL
jgi:hypothetical protein